MFNLFKKPPKKELTLGQWGELKAQELYKAKGFSILESNFFNRKGKQMGELDFIAKNIDCICFVEVKTRVGSGSKFGSGIEAVNIYKQLKLLKAVKLYLLKHQEYSSLRPQIDVCQIEVDEFDRERNSVIILTNAVEDWN